MFQIPQFYYYCIVLPPMFKFQPWGAPCRLFQSGRHLGLLKLLSFPTRTPALFPFIHFLVSIFKLFIFPFRLTLNTLFSTFSYLHMALTTHYSIFKSVHKIRILILFILPKINQNVGKNSCVLYSYPNYHYHPIIVLN